MHQCEPSRPGRNRLSARREREGGATSPVRTGPHTADRPWAVSSADRSWNPAGPVVDHANGLAKS
ncbi:hypothetical protein CRV15_35070 (plasmid) [Streptomyces clavuligerus]|uniref:Uncharacterized protein n=1 Tax=Streptomyces clavuligerus TaxID=1901 RepID=B5GLQ2_STRCL|nr:hypothetical protein SSCG_00276 [Streptomyces clavuligerus]EFG04912.1 Hypothetical protein SCLAV_p1430 [Streptomyces clavuligerus]QCS10744.1 hypothetical protein CRV15_35070 [Streptomyces clavuligerus]QPJ97220.1 hypothetical protein GE265_29410 [Streptomyces clavuligerus]